MITLTPEQLKGHTAIDMKDFIETMNQLIEDNKSRAQDIKDIKKILRMLLSNVGDESYRYGN